jgi:hypothetical protein
MQTIERGARLKCSLGIYVSKIRGMHGIGSCTFVGKTVTSLLLDYIPVALLFSTIVLSKDNQIYNLQDSLSSI